MVFFQAGLFMFAQMPQPDLTFGEGGFVSSEDNLLSDMRILPDGKIMVTGTKPGGTSPNLIVKRLLHNG